MGKINDICGFICLNLWWPFIVLLPIVGIPYIYIIVFPMAYGVGWAVSIGYYEVKKSFGGLEWQRK